MSVATGLRHSAPDSARQRLVHGRCRGTIGAGVESDHNDISIGKAGRTRWMGWRPHNRGVVMQPDRTIRTAAAKAAPRAAATGDPVGQTTKGKKTVRISRPNRFILLAATKRQK